MHEPQSPNIKCSLFLFLGHPQYNKHLLYKIESQRYLVSPFFFTGER